MEYFLGAFQKYAVFSGRARRKEYWMYTLFCMIAAIIVGVIDGLLNLGFLSVIFSLGVFIPSLAIMVRRLHDVGKSGWWYFISLIPLAGPIWLLVLLCSDSQTGANQYGDSPKYGNGTGLSY